MDKGRTTFPGPWCCKRCPWSFVLLSMLPTWLTLSWKRDVEAEEGPGRDLTSGVTRTVNDLFEKGGEEGGGAGC